MDPEIVFNIQSGPAWDWRVAMDLYLGGAGVGAILFAVLVNYAFAGRYRRLTRTAAWIGPVLVAIGLVLIMAKMGRPFNAWQNYVNVSPLSPLWWGGIFQPLLVGVGLLYAWSWRDAEANVRWRNALGIALVPLTVIVGAYHGLLLSVLNSRPLWNTGPTVIAALLAFATTGVAVVLLAHLVRMWIGGRLSDRDHLGRFLDDLRVVRNTLLTLLVMQLGTAFVWWLGLRLGSLDQQQALAAANEAYGPMFWYGGIVLGLVLPLLLGGTELFLGEARRRRGAQVATIALTSGMILVGGYFFRLALVLGGQADLPVNLFF
ncbi:MAG: NrfD/PsrC family molybdoenzyme membrane anchor subunit [Trueperaceae bacterium]|nr:NrfD/PsrC family molybdoenzyme membrane anchor subunit [Trueperaceae bacterium]